MYQNISLLKDELNHNMTMAVLPVTIFIGFEAFVGLFGNIFILLIYSRRYKQSNFRSIVLSLAIVDLTSCCTTLPGEIFSQLNWYHYDYDWICKLKSYFNIFTAWSSASILLILAFDRFRKICHPLAWQIYPTLAWQMCGVSFILSCFVSIPVTIFWGKQSYVYEIRGENLTVSVCEKSDQYADGIYPLVYIGSVYMLPVSLMIFVAGSLNFLTARKLFGHDIAFEVRSRRLSISATTLTSLSFVADATNVVGNVTTPNEILQQLANDRTNQLTAPTLSPEQPNNATNPITSSKLSTNSMKEVIPDDSCPNISLTSVIGATNKSKTFDKRSSFLDSPDNLPRTLLTSASCLDVNITPGRRKSRSDKNDIGGTCKINAGLTDSSTSKKSNCHVCGNSRNCLCSESDNGLRHKIAEKSPRHNNLKSKFHRWQKTIIMLVLTTVFVFTMSTYVILTSFVAKPDSILKELPNSKKVVFFFFWRLYFVNSVVNPILYGFMDPRFRSGFMSFIPGCKSKKKKISRSRAATSVMI